MLRLVSPYLFVCMLISGPATAGPDDGPPPTPVTISVEYETGTGQHRTETGQLIFDPKQRDRARVVVRTKPSDPPVFEKTINLPQIGSLRDLYSSADPNPIFTVTKAPYLGEVGGYAAVPYIATFRKDVPLQFSFTSRESPWFSIYGRMQAVNGTGSKKNPMRWVESEIDAIITPNTNFFSQTEMERAPDFRVLFPTPQGYRDGWFGGVTPDKKIWVVEGDEEAKKKFRSRIPGDYRVRLIEAESAAVRDLTVLSGKPAEPLEQSRHGDTSHTALYADMIEVAKRTPLPYLPGHLNPESAVQLVHLTEQDSIDRSTMRARVTEMLPPPKGTSWTARSVLGKFVEICKAAFQALLD